MNECLKTLVIIYLFYNGLNICLCHGMHFNIPSIFGNCFLHPFFNSCTYKKTQTNNNIPSPNHPTPSHPTSTQPLNTTATGKHWGMVLSGWVVKYFGLFGGEEGVASILFRISNSFLAIEFYTPLIAFCSFQFLKNSNLPLLSPFDHLLPFFLFFLP